MDPKLAFAVSVRPLITLFHPFGSRSFKKSYQKLKVDFTLNFCHVSIQSFPNFFSVFLSHERSDIDFVHLGYICYSQANVYWCYARKNYPVSEKDENRKSTYTY